MPQKLTVRELKAYLKSRTQEELVNDIAELFGKLDAVRDYYALRLLRGYDEELLTRYKAVIENEFFPKRGDGGGRLSVARRAVNDYKKASASLLGLVEIMLFYVEMGVKFTNTYGDIDEPFYNSMESMYKAVVKLIAQKHLQAEFQARCRQIVSDTSGIGWGFHDVLTDIYEEAFPTED